MKSFSIYIWTTALLGLFAGGAITVLFVLVPFWKSLEPTGVMDWFQNFGWQIGITMAPMEFIPFLFSIIAYFMARKANDTGKNLWLCVIISNVIILAMLPLYFIPVNLSFIRKTILPENVHAEMVRWEMVHIARTVFSVLSFVIGILAVSRTMKKRAGN